MSKKAILIIVGVILAVVGFMLFTQPASDSGNGDETASASNHIWSTGSTGVELVEYGDFQCPACASYFPALGQVKEKYKDLVTFQFRHFPLESIHKNARAGSRAAEAAGNQGKFWEMHDYLYQNQQSWQDASDPLTIFESYAQAVGVPDIERFKTEMRGSAVNAVINADLDAGRALGASSTPTFILDGQKLTDNPQPTLESFSALLDAKIEEKTGKPPVFNSEETPQQ